MAKQIFLRDDATNHYDDGGGHIQSSNIYDEVTSFDTIANAQTDMIFHYDEVVTFDTIANAQTDMIFHYEVVATFDSIDNAQTDMIFRYEEVVNDDSMDDTQIDMIYHPDDKAIFYSIPVNQNDSFLSLFLLFFQTIIF